MDRGRIGRIARSRHIKIPANANIASVTHPDTNKHTLDLATILTETRPIIMIIAGASRTGGTGNLQFFANEGTYDIGRVTAYYVAYNIILAAGTNRLQYQLTVANDAFDVYCFGYEVEA